MKFLKIPPYILNTFIVSKIQISNYSKVYKCGGLILCLIEVSITRNYAEESVIKKNDRTTEDETGGSGSQSKQTRTEYLS